MSKNNGKAGFVFRLVMNVILLVEYLFLLYTVVSSFSFVPWYDAGGGELLNYLVLWIPLCVTTIIILSAMFVTKNVYRPRVMLLCFNALVVPLSYLIETSGIGWLLTALRVLCLICVIIYFVLFVISVKNKTL